MPDKETIKILLLLLALPCLAIFGLWADYTYKKAIVKRVLQEIKDETAVQSSKNP